MLLREFATPPPYDCDPPSETPVITGKGYCGKAETQSFAIDAYADWRFFDNFGCYFGATYTFGMNEAERANILDKARRSGTRISSAYSRACVTLGRRLSTGNSASSLQPARAWATTSPTSGVFAPRRRSFGQGLPQFERGHTVRIPIGGIEFANAPNRQNSGRFFCRTARFVAMFIFDNFPPSRFHLRFEIWTNIVRNYRKILRTTSRQ